MKALPLPLMFKLAHRTATVWALRLDRSGRLWRDPAVPLADAQKEHQKARRASLRYARRFGAFHAATQHQNERGSR